MNATFKDFAKLHFIVFLWGFTAILGNEMTMSSADVVMYRTGIATLVLGVFMFFTKRSLKFDWKVLGQFGLTGLIIAAHWFLFFESARVSTVSVCLAGMATTSFWTSIVEPIVNRRKVNAIEVILGLAVIVGLYVIFRFEFNHALGLTLAIASAFLAAVFAVFNSRLVKQHSEYGLTFWEMATAFIGIVLFIPIYKSYFLSDSTIYQIPILRDWGLLLILALVCTVYAFSASVELMRRISAFAVNLTVNLEPIYGIIVAVILYGEKEQMSNGFYFGTLIILGAVLSYPLLRRRQRKRGSIS